jgi:hypothetical protein
MMDVLVVVVALAGAWAGCRGVRLLISALAHAEAERSSLDLIRGLRGIAVAVGTAALAAGVLLEQRWLLVFGAVFLLEELYETGVVVLVLRAARRSAASNHSAMPRSSRRSGWHGRERAQRRP